MELYCTAIIWPKYRLKFVRINVIILSYDELGYNKTPGYYEQNKVSWLFLVLIRVSFTRL